MTQLALMRASDSLGVTGGSTAIAALMDASYDVYSYPLDAPFFVATGSHRKFSGLFYEVESATEFSLDRGGY